MPVCFFQTILDKKVTFYTYRPGIHMKASAVYPNKAYEGMIALEEWAGVLPPHQSGPSGYCRRRTDSGRRNREEASGGKRNCHSGSAGKRIDDGETEINKNEQKPMKENLS